MRTNFHTHSLWCDGKDSAEKVVQAAIAKNFKAIGFSSHVAFPLANEWDLAPEKAQDYVAEITALKEKYRHSIEIYLGAEADYIPKTTTPERSRYREMNLDYLIGSVHTVLSGSGERVWVDYSPEKLAEGIKKHFNGNPRSFAEAYFRQQREMLQFDFDIIAHPDLLRKFNHITNFFDEQSQWYKAELEMTADSIAASGKIVEINTGAISRGWMNDAYPSAAFRELLRARNVPFILSSDAHTAETVDCAFDIFGDAENYIDFGEKLKKELCDCPAGT